MRNILDAPGFDKPEEEEIKTNFQKWAFRLLITTVISILLNQYIVLYWMNSFEQFKLYSKFSNFLSLAITLSLCFGLFCTILSIVYKEEKNYKFYISAIGYFIIILFAFA